MNRTLIAATVSLFCVWVGCGDPLFGETFQKVDCFTSPELGFALCDDENPCTADMCVVDTPFATCRNPNLAAGVECPVSADETGTCDGMGQCVSTAEFVFSTQCFLSSLPSLLEIDLSPSTLVPGETQTVLANFGRMLVEIDRIQGAVVTVPGDKPIVLDVIEGGTGSITMFTVDQVFEVTSNDPPLIIVDVSIGEGEITVDEDATEVVFAQNGFPLTINIGGEITGGGGQGIEGDLPLDCDPASNTIQVAVQEAQQ